MNYIISKKDAYNYLIFFLSFLIIIDYKLSCQELNETRTRTTTSTEEVDGGLTSEYEDKLADALREMREEHDHHLQMVREEIETFYETKVRLRYTHFQKLFEIFN